MKWLIGVDPSMNNTSICSLSDDLSLINISFLDNRKIFDSMENYKYLKCFSGNSS